MPLIDVPLEPDDADLPRPVRRFLAAAEKRIAAFLAHGRTFGFVPSDYSGAYRILSALADAPLARGRSFCEWGSGFGVVAGLAALLDFDACGIEIEAELIGEARQLAADFDLPVEFAHGSFVPRGAADRVSASGEFAWLTTEADYAYEDLGLDVADFDVVFAYPWPDEEVVTAELFERHAGVGAILVSYHGMEDFRVRRKVAKRPRRR